MKGNFERTTGFRRLLYETCVKTLLPGDDDRFVRNYLTRLSTAWVTPDFRTTDFLYIKKDSDIDDLPF